MYCLDASYYTGYVVPGGFTMEGKYTIYKRKMNYYETDQMGIIHHSNYIRLFEEARLDIMDKSGINYADIEEMGIIIPVMSVDCKYLIPLYLSLIHI